MAKNKVKRNTVKFGKKAGPSFSREFTKTIDKEAKELLSRHVISVLDGTFHKASFNKDFDSLAKFLADKYTNKDSGVVSNTNTNVTVQVTSSEVTTALETVTENKTVLENVEVPENLVSST